MAKLGNQKLAEEFRVDADLDRQLAHKIDDDYWGDSPPEAVSSSKP